MATRGRDAARAVRDGDGGEQTVGDGEGEDEDDGENVVIEDDGDDPCRGGDVAGGDEGDEGEAKEGEVEERGAGWRLGKRRRGVSTE